MNVPVAAKKRKRPRSAPAKALTAGQICQGHLCFAWISLTCFCLLGLALEGFHAFKIDWYLEMAYRRGCWMAAHATGTCFSLLHILFAVTVIYLSDWQPKSRRGVSCALYSASLLIPAGFFLAGCFLRDGKPGMGIGLVLAAAVLLVSVLVVTAITTSDQRSAGNRR